VVREEDWRLVNGDYLRGATFVFMDWSPPPAAWVSVSWDDDGRCLGMSMRTEPGVPGWSEGERPVWDHDHCESCMQRLTNDPGYEDGQPSGWRTGQNPGEHRWVCTQCFTDFESQLDFERGSSSSPGKRHL
jgi:hypothetical protein